MKTLFLQARLKETFLIDPKSLHKLPSDLILTTTIQYLDSLPGIQQQLEENKITVELFKGPHSSVEGQILGCDIVSVKKPVLYIGEGEFHPMTLALLSSIDVFCYDPMAQELKILDTGHIETITSRKKGALLKFHHANHIGVLVSTKPGQEYLKRAMALQDQYPDKEWTIFLADTIDFSELENYTFVEVWVNTSCPRVGWDDIHRSEKPMIDLGDLDTQYSRR